MSLHKKNYNVQDETWQTTEVVRNKHLQRMILPELASSGKVEVRAPEMKGGTTIAALPYPDFPTDGSEPTRVLPDRWNDDPTEPRSYNRWLFIASDKGVMKFGRQNISVLFDNPDDPGWDFDNDHPIQLIASRTGYAVRKGIDVQTPYGSAASDDWEVLFKGSENPKKFAIIKYPEVLFLTYAVVYASGSNNYFNDRGAAYGASLNDPLVVFVMSRSTGAGLMDEIDKPLVNNKPSEGLLHPSVTGCKFIHIYDKKLPSCPMIKTATSGGSDNDDGFGVRLKTNVRLGEKTSSGFGYAVTVTDTLDGTENGKKINRDAVSKYVLKRLMPWEKVLRGHTPQECADLVQTNGGLPLSILAHAWQSHPEYFTETTKSLMKGMVHSFPQHQAPAGPKPQRPGAELEAFDFGAPAEPGEDGGDEIDDTPDATIPFSAPAPQVQGSATDSLYSPDRVKAAHDSLRAALSEQNKTGHVPTIPAPPPFRKPTN